MTETLDGLRWLYSARMDGQTLIAENTPVLRLIDVAEAAERVVRAARDVVSAFDNDEFDTSNMRVETVLLRLCNAVDEYLALTGDVRDGGGA